MPSKNNKRVKAAERSATLRANNPDSGVTGISPAPAQIEAVAQVATTIQALTVAPAPTPQPIPPPEKLPALTTNSTLNITTNSFKMALKPTKIYRYDVTISKHVPKQTNPIVLTGTEGGSRRRQEECRLILEKAKKKLGIESIPMAYDGAAILYSTGGSVQGEVELKPDELPKELQRDAHSKTDPIKQELPEGPQETTNQLIIKIKISFNSQFVLRADQQSIQMLNIALRQTALDKGLVMATKSGSELFKTSGDNSRKAGIAEIDGIGAGIKVAQGGTHLVLDYKKKLFFKPGPLLGLQSLDWKNPSKLRQFLKGLKLGTTYSDQTLMIANVSEESIDQIRLDNGESLLAHSAAKSGKKITDFNGKLPAIQSNFYSKKDEKWIRLSWPIENLVILPGQQVSKKQSEILEMVPQAVLPHIRINKTKEVGKQAGFWEKNGLLQKFGITVEPEPIQVKGASVLLPEIKYKNGRKETPDPLKKASWRIPTTQFNSGFVWPTNIKKIVILYNSYVTPRALSAVNDFKEGLEKFSRGLGVNIRSIQVEDLHQQSVESAIVKRMEQLKTSNPKPIVVYADYSKSSIHKTLKLEERRCEIIVQHLSLDKSLKKQDASTLNNILMKLNLKNGGLNHKVTMPSSEISHLWGDKSNTLIISYDVCHSSGKVYREGELCTEPSTVGFGFNGTRFPEMIIGDFHYQETRQEQVEPDILTLRAKLMLELYISSRGKVVPDQIVILRDGVSEGQYGMVMEKELPSIKKGINIGLEVWKSAKIPKFALIITTKRHTHRLYVVKNGGIDSVPPLTAIDHTIVRDIGIEMILVSHCKIAGTAQPILLNMLLNEQVFRNNNQLSQFVIALCSSHQKSANIVSLPESVYAADEYAKRGADLFESYKARGYELPKIKIEGQDHLDWMSITQRLCYHMSDYFKSRRIA